MSYAIVDPRSPLMLLAAGAAVHIDEGATLGEAAGVMEQHRLSAVLVGDPAIGIVTERDLARGLASGFGADDFLAPFISRPVITVTRDTTIVDAAALMLNEEIRHVVVVLDGVPVIVSLREVMAALLQAVEPRSWLASLRLALTSEL